MENLGEFGPRHYVETWCRTPRREVPSLIEEDALRERRPVLLVFVGSAQAYPKETEILFSRLLIRLFEVGILSPSDLLFYRVGFAPMNAEEADVRETFSLERRHAHELLHVDDDVQPDMSRCGEQVVQLRVPSGESDHIVDV